MSHDGMCHRFKFLNKKICLNFKTFEKKNILQYVLEVGKVASDNSNLEIQICLNARVIFWTVFGWNNTIYFAKVMKDSFIAILLLFAFLFEFFSTFDK